LTTELKHYVLQLINFKLYFTVASADVYCTFRIRHSITRQPICPITLKKHFLKVL